MTRGLKGSQRIIYEALDALLQGGAQVSQSVIARTTGYHKRTVARVLHDLATLDMIAMQPTRPGCRCLYEVREDQRWIA
jgi:DNA-binding IclR family transcriptional regulator